MIPATTPFTSERAVGEVRCGVRGEVCSPRVVWFASSNVSRCVMMPRTGSACCG